MSVIAQIRVSVFHDERIIRKGMTLERAIDAKLENETVSKRTLGKLNALFNQSFRRLETTGTTSDLTGFRSVLTSIENGLLARAPSKAKDDLLNLVQGFHRRLDDCQPGCRSAEAPSPERVPAPLHTRYALHIGYVGSHAPDSIDSKHMSLSAAFGAKALNRSVSTTTLGKLDDVFERISGIALHPTDESDAPALKAYDFASPYRSDFRNLRDLSAELEALHEVLNGMAPCQARDLLQWKLSVYETHVTAAERFWKTAETALQTRVPEVRDTNAPAASDTQRLVNVQQLKLVLTWLGWPRDLIARELDAIARRT